MNIDNELDALKRIKQIEVPPFLLTRIKQQIQNLGNGSAPVKWRWVFTVSTVLIFALNMAILFKTDDNTAISAKTNGLEYVIQSMNLTTTNQLYND